MIMDIERHHFSTIDSTNTWAKQHAHELPRDKITLVTADVQTAGRGRFNRRWESPAGENVLATFCFFLEKHRQDIGNIPQVLAISTAKVLQDLAFTPELKWPNDVLLSGKKVAGILAETTPLSDLLCVIVGIGLNVNMQKEDLDKIDRPATSLYVERGKAFIVAGILDRLQNTFCKDLDLFLNEGFHPFLQPYRSYLSKDITKVLRFHDNRTIWEGIFHAINEDGSLVLKLLDGKTRTFVAGEILF